MLYKKVMQDLSSRINSDEFEVGDTLPTEKALSEQYGVSESLYVMLSMSWLS